MVLRLKVLVVSDQLHQPGEGQDATCPFRCILGKSAALFPFSDVVKRARDNLQVVILDLDHIQHALLQFRQVI